MFTFSWKIHNLSAYHIIHLFIYLFVPQPPKAKCLTRIWHPNIAETGEICLRYLCFSLLCFVVIILDTYLLRNVLVLICCCLKAA